MNNEQKIENLNSESDYTLKDILKNIEKRLQDIENKVNEIYISK